MSCHAGKAWLAWCALFQFPFLCVSFSPSNVPCPPSPTTDLRAGSHLIPSLRHPSSSLFPVSPPLLYCACVVGWGADKKCWASSLFVTVMNTTPSSSLPHKLLMGGKWLFVSLLAVRVRSHHNDFIFAKRGNTKEGEKNNQNVMGPGVCMTNPNSFCWPSYFKQRLVY